MISKSYIGLLSNYAHISCILHIFQNISTCIFEVTLIFMICILYTHAYRYEFISLYFSSYSNEIKMILKFKSYVQRE